MSQLVAVPENTLVQRIGRYRVMIHETFSEKTQSELRTAGIDPETLHVVGFSYDNQASAQARLAVETARNRNPNIRYVFHDAGIDEYYAPELGWVA